MRISYVRISDGVRKREPPEHLGAGLALTAKLGCSPLKNINIGHSHYVATKDQDKKNDHLLVIIM